MAMKSHSTARFALLVFTLLAGMLTMGCSDDDSDSGSSTSTQEGTADYRRTVVVYMSMQNNLGLSDAHQLDSAEIAQGALVMPSTDDNLILYMDDELAPRIYRFYKTSSGSAYVSKVYQYPSDMNSSDPATLTDVLTRVKNLYPSESYALVLSSHGWGWLTGSLIGEEESASSVSMRAFGLDVGDDGDMSTNYTASGYMGDVMDDAEIAEAVSDAGIHLDWLFFDACVMQAIETAYELREVTDYVVASPIMTSGYGAYYRDMMRDAFFEYPTDDETVKALVDTYYYDAVENDTTKAYYEASDCGVVYSVVKTSKLEALATATAKVIDEMLDNRYSSYLDYLMDGYIDFLSMGYPDYYDMGVALHNLLSEETYEEWRPYLDDCLIYQVATERYYMGEERNSSLYGYVDFDYYCGASMFVPQTKYDRYGTTYNTGIATTAWYQAVY